MNKKIYGKNNIILSNQIQREDLNTLIQLVEKHSVWEKIQEQADQEENIKISVDNTGTYMSKRIESNSKITEISVVEQWIRTLIRWRQLLMLLMKF
ncbi:hypothetical protein ONA22_06795 [Mycoplasmopsis cynos]|uniref:hypothetical protein n=1 Tax=Mycoplasmopsis cynos TaxID=171284 RepID=UPI0024CAB0FB|nr:hypothetical protein [Mycoplasmopsis cynos]WAM03378.1 hypothetical protein ONA22_06795 [Mycoplasmopsis cynos]